MMQNFPFSRPMYIMAKPAGAQCNLNCRYCYYKGKQQMYGDGRAMVMTDDVLEAFVKGYIESQTMPAVLFTWHGGEPMLRPLQFYEKAVVLQKKYAEGRIIDNCIQTNGMLITDEWCRFLSDNGWLVGVSIDGPQEYHDKYRKARGGKPTFCDVMQGIEKLEKYGVQWNAMAVVNDYNGNHPTEFYHFFRQIGCRYIQFAPIVEPGLDCNVQPRQWGDFLCAVFDEWIKKDVGEYYVQIFDAMLARWVGEEAGVCIFNETCGQVGVMEYNGDVYSCDHFVFPEYKLGNMREKTFVEMMYSERQRSFGAEKHNGLPMKCRKCRFMFACNGECPKNRILTDGEGEKNLNYLCEGYYHFYVHIAPYMDYMKQEYLAGRPPANVMNVLNTRLPCRRA